RAKRDMLGVNLQTIDRYGLTSEEVAREMALGALQRCGASVTLANTGLAEAEGPMDGVVCFACAMTINGEQRVLSETRKFHGERNAVREQAARHALFSLDRYINDLRNPALPHCPSSPEAGRVSLRHRWQGKSEAFVKQAGQLGVHHHG